MCPAPESSRDRIADYIRGLRPTPICSRCLTARLSLTDGTVRHALAMLGGRTGFVRADERCGVCGKERFTIRAA